MILTGGNFNPEPHICDEFCALAEGWPREIDRLVYVHAGARPVDYNEDLGEPPFCIVCGHELVTWPAAFGAVGELHADSTLEPQD